MVLPNPWDCVSERRNYCPPVTWSLTHWDAPGSRNRRPATHNDVGKTVKRGLTIPEHQASKGQTG